MQKQKIEFRKPRDFASTIGDSLKFLKQNFKPLFSAILLIVGPFLLLMGLAYGYMQATLMSNMTNPTGSAGMFGSMFSGQYFLAAAVVVFFALLTNVLLNSVVYNYMCLYNERSIEEKITLSEVNQRVLSNLGRLLGSVLVFTLLCGVIMGAIALIFVGIASVMGIAGGVILGILLVFGLIILVPVLSYFVPAGFYVVVRDGEFIFSALGKVRKYLSGNFWWTWLIMVVTLMGLGILQTLFSLPASIVSMINTFSRMKEISNVAGTTDTSVLLIVLYTVSIFLSTCTYSISTIISAFNFLSHEEQHEGKGLLSRIDEIN